MASSTLPDPFCRSSWWWPTGVEPVPDQYADFCCDFVVPGEIDDASISVTCGSWFTVWLNGIWLHHGPLREVSPWQYYDTLDLREHLVAARNRLRIRAYHCGVSHQSHEACLAGLLVGGGIPGIGLDFSEVGNWSAALSPGFLPDAPRLHPCQGFGEHVDLTEDPDAWLLRDGEGDPPSVVAPHPLPGREKLLRRDLPPFSGQTFTATRRHVAGGWQVWSFDREVFGFLMLDVEVSVALSCELLHGESLTADHLPDYGFGGGDFRELLELPAGRHRWTSFEKRALCHLALPADCRVHALSVREYQRPLVEIWRGTPEALPLDARDTAIVAAAARTVAICCDDLLNDCPRRERAQYSDPAVYMEAFPLLFGTWEPVRRWLRQYLRGAGPDGVLRMCYPSPPGTAIIPDFSLAFAGNVLRYFEATGDLETLRECQPFLHAGVAAFDRNADGDGLLRDVPGWVFLCNSFELAKHPRSAALNALWADAWKNLGIVSHALGDPGADAFFQQADTIRTAWRNAFWKNGRILDADSNPQDERHVWWNYHYEADCGRFADPQKNPGTFQLKVQWLGAPRRLSVCANGRVRVWHGGHVLLDETPDNPWTKPPLFHAWTIELPPGFKDGELLVEAAWNPIDWEVFLAADTGQPGTAQVGGAARDFPDRQPTVEEVRAVELRPWQAPRHNQITAGYAIASGMLDDDEARAVLTSCLRAEYHVPWMKRTTPLIAMPTSDARLIAERATLCNTPYSLAFFCRALSRHGMQEAARDLCRRLYGAMIDAGSTTLWEEFAPRSSLCHAWGAMCVPYILPAAIVQANR